MKLLQSVLLVCFFTVCLSGQSSTGLKSPNGQLEVSFDTASSGQLTYRIAYRGKPLMDPSNLRLDFQGSSPLGSNVKISGSQPAAHDETYHLIHGKVSTVRDHYNSFTIEAVENSTAESFIRGRNFSIEARAYDDAIAFRYVVKEQPPFVDFRLTAETTEFKLSKDPITYSLLLPNYRSMYESEFVKLPASAFANQGGVTSSVLIGLPLLLNVPGVAWAAISEADLQGNSSMYLTNLPGGWNSHGFESRLAPDSTQSEIVTYGALPHHSAWRVVMVADSPGSLVENNVLTSLNPPSAIADTSWIIPGKAAWDWWSGSINAAGQSAFNTETMKYYVDFAAQQKLEYMQIDAGWSALGDITKMNGKVDVPEVVRYAAAKGVKVWIWLHWAAVDKQMNEAFALYEKWGVAGMKIDFISHDNQSGMDWYYRVAEKAAQHHLMVDFHGATKPTGMERTWPNIMGYEAVLGMEQSKGGGRDNPENHVTLPFTRMLAGPMDYTPGGFDNVTQSEFVARGNKPMVMGTRAHHLAMYAVFESPYQMVSDSPEAYKDQPSFKFIKDTPSTWDETRVLNGEPGEFITVARRHGSEWYLGSMTNWTARQIDLSLSFLGAGSYRAEIYADAEDAGKNPKNTRLQERVVDRNTNLKISMVSGGGYALRLVPVKAE